MCGENANADAYEVCLYIHDPGDPVLRELIFVGLYSVYVFAMYYRMPCTM